MLRASPRTSQLRSSPQAHVSSLRARRRAHNLGARRSKSVAHPYRSTRTDGVTKKQREHEVCTSLAWAAVWRNKVESALTESADDLGSQDLSPPGDGGHDGAHGGSDSGS